MGVTLRQYQKDAIEAVRAEFKAGIRRTVVVMPTGTGKTVVFVGIVEMARAKNNRVLILVHSEELVKQTARKLGDVGIRAGIVKRQLNQWGEDVVIASVQTLSRESRLLQIPSDMFKMVIVDECHYSYAPTWQKILKHFESWHVGVTATPFRGDRKSLARAGWQSVAYVYSIQEAIKDGHLVLPQAFRILTSVSLDEAKRKKNAYGESDFSDDSLAKIINTPERNSTIVDAWLNRSNGLKTLCFCVDIQHAYDLANCFRKVGIDARAISGKTPMAERAQLLAEHQAGHFPILTNCAVLTTGYDDPSLESIVMARPTQSKTLYVQMLGRGLRPCAGKQTCIILDIVDSTKEHKLLIFDELLQLQREMSYAEREEQDQKRIKKEALEGEQKPRKRMDSEGDPEEWRAKEQDILGGKNAIPDKELKQKQPATPQQRTFLESFLKNRLRWPDSAAKNASVQPELTREGVRKFIGRATYNHVKPSDFL